MEGLPKGIGFIKENGADWAAAYTVKNCIVFTDILMKGRYNTFKRVMAHEMFHVFSRYNPEIKEKLYE